MFGVLYVQFSHAKNTAHALMSSPVKQHELKHDLRKQIMIVLNLLGS